MIKLFWNTGNQIKPSSNDPNKEDVFDHMWGTYHEKNSDQWIYYILDKVKYKIIQSEKDLEIDDILIIVDSSIEKKSDLYARLRIICSKIFLIHLGDEAGSRDVLPIYANCNFVWRAFCSNKYFNNEKVVCLPIGFKSGIVLNKKNIRKYKWAFIGTPHKSSRHDLLFQLSDIKPSYTHKTAEFNKKIIEVDEMSEILSSTEFIPCPNGYVHPETYRLYEALECECIPIVENTYKYYERLFPDNPFLKIDKWIEAKSIIKKFGDKQIKQKREECKSWWHKCKNQLQESIKYKINL